MGNTDKLSRKYTYGASKSILSAQAVEVLNTSLERVREQLKKSKDTGRMMLQSMEYNIIKRIVISDYIKMLSMKRIEYNEVFLLSKGSTCNDLVDRVARMIQDSNIEDYENIPRKKKDIVGILINRHIDDKKLPYEIIEVAKTTGVPLTVGSKKELRAVPIGSMYDAHDVEDALKKKGINCLFNVGYVELIEETELPPTDESEEKYFV